MFQCLKVVLKKLVTTTILPPTKNEQFPSWWLVRVTLGVAFGFLTPNFLGAGGDLWCTLRQWGHKTSSTSAHSHC